MPAKITRQGYAEMFGPTTGDRVRLADTALIVEVEKDYTVYGEEVKFGGGKVIRDGMGQGQGVSASVADTVITNALIIDHWGIVKADVGLKGGNIWGIGKAGNPDVQHAYPFYLSATDRRGSDLRYHDHDRRRNGTGGRNQRHHLHAGTVAYPQYVARCGGFPHESWLHG